MKSKVTTGDGDAGNTKGLDGNTYSKAHPIMECVGAVDELRARTALVRQLILEEKPEDWKRIAEFLFWLLHTYFLIGAACSDPLKLKPERHQGEISRVHLEKLEGEQARLEERAKLPRGFIASASNLVAAHVDVASATARSLERRVVRLKADLAEFQAEYMLAFLNRLSDYLYILARYLENGEHIAVDFSILEKGR